MATTAEQAENANKAGKAKATELEYPCQLAIEVPFPTANNANVALKAFQVDPELSPMVTRKFTIIPNEATGDGKDPGCVFRAEYKATTTRMLRVATNTFMDGLALLLEVIHNLEPERPPKVRNA